MDHEASQVAARHFELAMFRQQQGTTAKSTYWGEDYPIEADFARNPKTATTARVAACEEATISWQQRGVTSTEQTKQFNPGGRKVNCSFLPSGYVAFCMLSCAFSILPFCKFTLLSCQVQIATRTIP